MIDKVVNNIINEKLYDLHTCVIGKITRVSGNVADVQPIPNRKYRDGKEQPYPLLINVPILQNEATVTISSKTISVSGGDGSVTIPEEVLNIDFREYQVGDRVLVVFSERALDGVGGRRHDLSDGLIVGVI
jgi:hypothetical protein